MQNTKVNKEVLDLLEKGDACNHCKNQQLGWDDQGVFLFCPGCLAHEKYDVDVLNILRKEGLSNNEKNRGTIAKILFKWLMTKKAQEERGQK